MKRVLIAAALGVSLPAALVVAHVAAGALQSQSLESMAATVVAGKLPGFRLATRGDFVPELRDQAHVPSPTQTVLREDFDGNGLQDWAVLVINESLKEYRIYYVLNMPDGYRFDLLMSKTWTEPSASRGVIRNALFLKRAGDLGVAQRHYARVLGDDVDPSDPKNNTPAMQRDIADRTEEYKRSPAIEVWTGPARIDAKDLRNFPDNGIAYCSTTWHYRRNGTLAHFSACD